jgi:hypothetical protein
MDLNDSGNRIIVGIIFVLLVIGAWYLGTTFKPAAGANGLATTTSTTTKVVTTKPTTGSSATVVTAASQLVAAGGDMVTVKDQPAGDSVMVTSVTMPELGWVAVRDGNGYTLGAALVTPGTHTNVLVPLLRVTVASGSYQVLLYSDDGDRQFDLHKDTLVTNSDGSVAGSSFLAQ